MPAPQKSRLRPQVIPLSDPEAISRLEQLQNSESQRRFAYQLGLLQPRHPQAVATLLKLMLTPQPARFYRRNAEYLQRITPPEQLTQIIPSLRQQAELIESGVRTEQAWNATGCSGTAPNRYPSRSFSRLGRLRLLSQALTSACHRADRPHRPIPAEYSHADLAARQLQP